VGSIPDQTLTEDGSATTVNVSARFSDPDGDALSYRAASSRTSVVRVSVSGSQVTLTPRDAGTATVTVTATDPSGLSATQRFTVTVTAANQAPRAVGSIPDQTLTEDGSSRTLDVERYFEDPDGDALTYRASSSRTSVVRVTVSGSELTLDPRNDGTATITVTARDPAGLRAIQTFRVTVAPEAPSGNTVLYEVGDRIPFPSGFPGRFVEISVRISGGQISFSASRGGYVEWPDYRFTCVTTRCEVVDSVVTAGTIARTPAGQEPGEDGGTPTGDTRDCQIEDLGTLRGTTPLTRSGSLGRDCESPNERGKLARYFSFRLSEASEVQIDLESSAFDTLLLLREGSNISGRQIERDDDGGSGTDSQIVRELSAGVYTIEATSFRRGSTGAFTIRVAQARGETPTGDAVVSAGELQCNIREQIPGSGVFSGSVSGRLRAVRAVTLVTVTGMITEQDGGRRVHSLIPDVLGSMRAGETKSFTSSGIFNSTATRARCSASVEWAEIRQTGQRSTRIDAPRSTILSPRN